MDEAFFVVVFTDDKWNEHCTQQSFFSILISELRKIVNVGLRQFSDEFREYEKFFQQ